MKRRRVHPLLRDQSGQVLIEFALISLVFYLLMAATIDFGRMIFTAQMLQDAARVAARELALTPLPAASTFEDALAEPQVLQRVFDPNQLVVDLDAYPDSATLDAYLASLPLVNQALRPLMINDRVNVGGVERNLLRFPGALLSNSLAPSGFSVGIPRVAARGSDGTETIEWVPVLSEVRSDPADPASGPFSLASVGPQRGVAAISINYPFQAALLSGFLQNAAGPLEPNIANPIVAEDAGVTELNAPPSGTTIGLDPVPGIYSGTFGLGHQLALVNTLRPYRKLLSAQAIFRREVMQ